MRLLPTLAFALGSSLAFAGVVLAVTPWLERHYAIGSTKAPDVIEGAYSSSWSGGGIRIVELEADGRYHWYETVVDGNSLVQRPDGLQERGTWTGHGQRVDLISTAGVQRVAYLGQVGEDAVIHLDGASYRRPSIPYASCWDR